MSSQAVGSEEVENPVVNQDVFICINCHATVVEKFCGSCGQPRDVKRISFKTLATDVYEKLFALDNKFTRTVADLIKDPNYVITEVLKGNRVKFFGAAGLYFILLTIYLLMMSILNISLEEITQTSREVLYIGEIDQKQMELSNKISSIISNNFRIFGFLMIPFFSLSLMIFYRRSGLNFFEHSVVVFYAFALGMVVNIFWLFVYTATGYSMQLYVMAANLILFAYIIARFYHKRIIPGILKGLLVYGLGYIFFMLVFTMAFTVVVLLDPSIIGM